MKSQKYINKTVYAILQTEHIEKMRLLILDKMSCSRQGQFIFLSNSGANSSKRAIQMVYIFLKSNTSMNKDKVGASRNLDKKRKLRVFISMPFTGKKFEELVKEREDLTKLVNSFGFELL